MEYGGTCWRDGKYEVDYFVERGKEIWAIEVKSGTSGDAKGLERFRDTYPEAKTLMIGGPEGELSVRKGLTGVQFVVKPLLFDFFGQFDRSAKTVFEKQIPYIDASISNLLITTSLGLFVKSQ